jgi:hypothetical protein
MSRRPKQLPPWSRHHEPWCAIVRGKPCDCDDEGRRRRRRRRQPLSGGDVAAAEREKEKALEES